jgi:methyl-accepting chemotaxis protein
MRSALSGNDGGILARGFMIRVSALNRLSVRLYALTALFGLGLLALGGSALWSQWNAARQSRIGELQVVTELAIKVIDSNRALVTSGALTEDAAKARSFVQLTAMTYGNGDYVSVIDVGTGKVVAHPNPKQVGTNSMESRDPTGFAFVADVLPRAVRDGSAMVSYQYPRLGEQTTSPKLAVYRFYRPWNLAVGTGAYVNDLTAEFHATALTLGCIAIGILAILVAASALVVRSVVRPIAGMVHAMRSLATGDTNTAVPDGGAIAETQAMAATVQVFKDAAIEKARAEAAAEASRHQADRARGLHEEASARIAAQQVAVVDALAAGMDRLAGGDLTVRLTEAFAADYERLRSDFNRTADQLAKTLGAIAETTSAIRTGTGEITSAADDLSRRTEQQAASLEQTAAALEQITTTVRKTAESASHARDIVATTQAGAQTSSQVVQDAVRAMTMIEKSAKEISQIIGVIDEIAFQTNLLALNAGVEAARAGDAGRGFAVVASEVRALAQRSAQAAKEIKALISTSTTQVERGVELVGATGRSLSQIIAEVGKINDVVVEIAASAHEQSSGLREVSTAVNQMDQITQQNAAMVEQSTAASHSLANEITELDRLTGSFRTGASTQPLRAVA